MLRHLPRFPSSAPRRLCGLLLLALALTLPTQVRAQTLTVQNGGTVEVSNGGTWDLHGTTVDLGGTGSTASIDETNSGRFAGGMLTATRTLNAPSAAVPAGLGVTISTSANLGDVTITRGHTVQTAPNGNESIQRYYDLTPSQNNSGLDAELTLAYADAELNGLTESTLEFFKSEDGGTSWSEAGADSRDGTANTVTLGGIASLSRWTLGSTSNPLPVEMTWFEATVEESGREDHVRLTWQTASETGNSGFEVQRRVEDDEGPWEGVGRVEGAGTTTNKQSYRFVDRDLPFAGDALTYRLKQVDTDGSAHYSETITVERGVDAVTLRDVYPNPARGPVTVQYALPESQAVSLRLYDVLGRQVRTVANSEQQGRQEARLDVSDLTSGIYFLRLQADRTVKTQRLIVAH